MYGLSNASPLVRLNVTFAVLNLCNTNNLRNIACFNFNVFTHKLEVHVVCDLNFILSIQGGGLLKVTDSHVH